MSTEQHPPFASQLCKCTTEKNLSTTDDDDDESFEDGGSRATYVVG